LAKVDESMIVLLAITGNIAEHIGAAAKSALRTIGATEYFKDLQLGV